MKNKIQEIENENFILKFIKDQTSKGIGHFAICQFKSIKKISFKLDLDFMLSNFKNCELSFDLSSNIIQCYTPKNAINTTILYIEEPITKEKNIINNFDINAFVEKIGNKIYSFDLIKYNISLELKFAINEKIIEIEKNLEFINKFIKMIKEIDAFLNNNKKNIINENSYKVIKEFKILQINGENLIDKTKRYILDIKKSIYINKPKSNFEIKGNNYIFKTKINEYIFYLYKKQKLEIILNTNDTSIFSVSYTDSIYDINLTINNDNEINMQIVNKYIIYIGDTNSFIGSILANEEKNNHIKLFGIEKGKKYLYMGHYINNNFAGAGLLITPVFYYKGKFSDSQKSDNKGYILFGDDNHFYKGGILGDELYGKGKYQNKKGIIIEGNFEKNNIKGLCKFTFNNGDEYQGEMNGNIKSGEWEYINKATGKKLKVIFNNETNETNYFY